MRTFVALVPPAAAVAPLREALAGLDLRAAGWRPGAPERWHLTLAFLDEVAEDALPALGTALGAAAAASPPLVLGVAGAGAFPRDTAARVLWAGLTGDVAALQALAARVERAAARVLHRAPERRAYRPHLTVARAAGRPVDARPAVAAVGGVTGPRWRAEELLLVRSHLGPEPRHERLSAYPLLGPPA